MKINIRRHSIYYDVQVEYHDTVIHLGLLDKEERKELINVLAIAIEELEE